MTARVRTSTWPLLVADALVLWLLAPSLIRLCHGVTGDPRAWILRSGVDAAVSVLAAGLLWLVAGWLAIALVTTLVSEAIGTAGGLLDRIARRITPSLVRKLVIATAGASIVLSSTVPASARPAAPSSGAASQAGDAATVRWPTDSATGDGIGSLDPVANDNQARLGAGPFPPTIPTPAPPLDPARPVGSPVRVTSGDSLWLIAAHRLGRNPTDRAVSVAWPYWYRANRRVIGSDPSMLRPGEQLVPPAWDGRS